MSRPVRFDQSADKNLEINLPRKGEFQNLKLEHLLASVGGMVDRVTLVSHDQRKIGDLDTEDVTVSTEKQCPYAGHECDKLHLVHDGLPFAHLVSSRKAGSNFVIDLLPGVHATCLKLRAPALY